MRILIADTYYAPFVAQHYRAHPGLAERPYAEQLASLQARRFGTSDSYSRNLRALGHQAAEVIVNCEPLQSAWWREHRAGGAVRHALARRRRRSGSGEQPRRITLEQIDEFAPDVLYVQDLWFFDRAQLDHIRSRGVRLVGQIASALPTDELLRGYEMIVTSFPHFVQRLERLGVAARYLPLAFDPEVLERLRALGTDGDSDSERSHAVSFVGGLDPEVHPGRVELLERICEEVGLDAWGYGANRLPDSSAIAARHHGEAWGLDMYQVLASSRIVINTHIEAAEGNANNMRLFEATGCGALLLTEQAPNLAELFQPGAELVTYEGAKDLVSKIRHLLEHSDERLRIAAAGQRRTLLEHRYDQRIAGLASMLSA